MNPIATCLPATVLAILLAVSTTANAFLDQPIGVPIESQVDPLFDQWNRTDSPGCVAFAFRDGRVRFIKSYGMADLESGRPLADDNVFYLASTSKQFAAAAVALLILDEKLSLRDEVREFIPELPDFGQPITVANLVYHTSGLRDYLALQGMKGDNSGRISNAGVLEILSRQQDLNFTPGSEWSYSNSNYVLMSVLVERVSGQSLNDFAQQRIFGPLGMNSSHFDDHHRVVVAGRARSYSPDPEAGWLRHPKLIEATGDGNLLSTVGDLQRWDENFYHGRVGGAEFLELIQRPGYPIPDREARYAFGLMVNDSYRGLPTVHHGGAFYGFRIQLLRFPDQHFSSGVLCNAGNADSMALSQGIADVFLADLLEPVAAVEEEVTGEANGDGDGDGRAEPEFEVALAVLSNLEGTYRSPEIDTEAIVRLRDGELWISASGGVDAELTPVSHDEFQMMFTAGPGLTLPVPVRIGRDAQGAPTHLLLDLFSIRNFRMMRVD